MAKYVVFFQFGSETLADLMDNPADREAAVRRVMEAVGGRLEAYYWMTGQYDGLFIVEAPDTVSVGAVSVAAGSSGAFSRLETHELIAPADLRRLLDKAQQARAAYVAAEPR